MARRKTVAKKRPSKATKQKARTPLRQLVITLHASNGEITKIEHLAASGQRRPVSDAEFTTLAGDNDLDDFSELIEAAYAAGVQDGFEDAISDDHFAESKSHGQGSEPESAGEHVLRAGVRRTVLRSALRRGVVRQAVVAHHNGAQGA